MGSERTGRRWVVGQFLLVALLVLTYFRVRALTVGSYGSALAHAHEVLRAEQVLGIDVESAMQAPVLASGVLWTLANWVYIWGHWPVIGITLLWLALRHRRVFRRLRNGMMVSGAIGMTMFALYPVAPPRLAGVGLVDTVTERSHAYRVLQPPGFVNQYAAMPSLHLGWDLLVGLAIATAATSVLLKVVGVVLPAAMALAVVVTANHYLLDAVAGVALVLLVHAGVLAVERARARRRSPPPAELVAVRVPASADR